MSAADPKGDGDFGKPRVDAPAVARVADAPVAPDPRQNRPRELGGPAGPEPTRFGDWEKSGRCIDF